MGSLAPSPPPSRALASINSVGALDLDVGLVEADEVQWTVRELGVLNALLLRSVDMGTVLALEYVVARLAGGMCR